jgi:hypothetical protein
VVFDTLEDVVEAVGGVKGVSSSRITWLVPVLNSGIRDGRVAHGRKAYLIAD